MSGLVFAGIVAMWAALLVPLFVMRIRRLDWEAHCRSALELVAPAFPRAVPDRILADAALPSIADRLWR